MPENWINPKKIIIAMLWAYIGVIVFNIGIFAYLTYTAHREIAAAARLIAYPVAATGYLPQGQSSPMDSLGLAAGETVTYQVYESAPGGGTVTRTIRIQQQMKNRYIHTLNEGLAAADNWAGNNIKYVNRFTDPTAPASSDAITVWNKNAGCYAYSKETAAQRGEPLEITVRGRLFIPILFYPGWQPTTHTPDMSFIIEKKITVLSEAFTKDNDRSAGAQAWG